MRPSSEKAIISDSTIIARVREKMTTCRLLKPSDNDVHDCKGCQSPQVCLVIPSKAGHKAGLLATSRVHTRHALARQSAWCQLGGKQERKSRHCLVHLSRMWNSVQKRALFEGLKVWQSLHPQSGLGERPVAPRHTATVQMLMPRFRDRSCMCPHMPTHTHVLPAKDP